MCGDQADSCVLVMKRARQDRHRALVALFAETQADLDDQEEEIDCVTCDGSGQVEGDEPSEEQVSAWQDEVRDVISVIDESPV